ncbi:MAG: MFS transporter [Acidimicrobiales bacterium]
MTKSADLGTPGAKQGFRQSISGGAPLLPLLVLAGLQFMDQANQSAFSVLIPNVRDAFHLSDAGILGIVAIASAGALLATVPVAMAADRFNRVWIAIIGAVVWSGFSIGLGAAGTAIVGGIMFSAMTMGQSVVFPTHNSLIADYYPVAQRQRVYSVHRFGLSLGAIFGVLVGAGLTVVTHNWRTAFFVFPVITVAVGLVGALKMREPERGTHELESLADPSGRAGASGSAVAELLEEASQVVVPQTAAGGAAAVAPPPEPPLSVGEAWRTVWKIQALRRIFLALPFLAAAIAGFSSLASLEYQRVFHLGVFQRAMFVAPVQVFDLIGIVIGARLGTRLVAKGGVRLVFRMIAVSSTMAAGFITLFALAPNVPIAFIGNAGIDLSLAVVAPGVLASLSLAIPSRARSLGFSIGALWILPGLVVIPIVGAVGDEIGLRYGMLILVPVFILGGLIVATAGSVIDADARNVWTSIMVRAEMLAARRAGRLPLLAVKDARIGYGSVRIIDGLDFDVSEGEIVAVLGTNGAGKSTLLRAIGGVVEADGGAIVFDGRDITHMPPQEIARLGISQAPGGESVFANLSVDENLRAAAWQDRKDEALVQHRLGDVLSRFPTLAERLSVRAGDLSGGQQQMLGLAMIFLGKPKILLVDELSLGLAPIVVDQLLDALRTIRDQGTAIVLVEQSVNIALAVADRAYVMDKGAIVFSGTAAELEAAPDVLRSVYLKGAAGRIAVAAPLATLAATDAALSPFSATGETVADPGASAADALELRAISVSFGGVIAVNEVSLRVDAGDIVGIIGPNGAGKTTLFDVVCGFTHADEGRVLIGGVDMTRRPPGVRARLGLGRSFQDSRLFGDLTVRETLAVALERFIDGSDPLSDAMRLPDVVLTEAAVKRRVDELIEAFGLQAFDNRLLSELSTGSRRLVDLAGVVAHAPHLVLLDEPSSGIAQREVEELAEVLARVRAELGATFVVIEHDIAFVRTFARRLIALDRGSVIADGDPEWVLGEEAVQVAFLGGGSIAASRSGSDAPAAARHRGNEST